MPRTYNPNRNSPPANIDAVNIRIFKRQLIKCDTYAGFCTDANPLVVGRPWHIKAWKANGAYLQHMIDDFEKRQRN